MRVWSTALLAALSLTACAAAGPSAPAPADTTASAPFYLETHLKGGSITTPAVRVINGFTGQVEATIAAPASAGSLSWNPGRPVWYPCGAAPDDRTFLLCGARQYWELRLQDDGKPQRTSAPAAIPAAARNTGNGDPYFAVSAGRRFAAAVTDTGIMVMSLVTGATRSWAIPAADGYATSLSWAGDRYVAFQFFPPADARAVGGVRVLDTASAATTALAASRLVIANAGQPAAGIIGVFNPVITSDGTKILAAAWTRLNVAELAEFSARTGRLLAVLMPAASMPGHGSPCQVLWTDLSGSALIAYCGTSGVINGTHLTPVNLHIPDTSGIVYTGLLW